MPLTFFPHYAPSNLPNYVENNKNKQASFGKREGVDQTKNIAISSKRVWSAEERFAQEAEYRTGRIVPTKHRMAGPFLFFVLLVVVFAAKRFVVSFLLAGSSAVSSLPSLDPQSRGIQSALSGAMNSTLIVHTLLSSTCFD